MAGFFPSPTGKVIPINFIVNESDGKGRANWIGLTSGIGEGKNPAIYRKFVLVPKVR